MNFTNYTFYLKKANTLSTFVFGLGNLIALDLIAHNLHGQFLAIGSNNNIAVAWSG